MTRSLSMMEARARLTTLPEELEQSPETGAISVTRRGKPVLAVMHWDLYDSLVETLEILGDSRLMRQLRKGIEDAKRGRSSTTRQIRKKLGL